MIARFSAVFLLLAVTVLPAAVASSTPALAAQVETIGVFQDWTAYRSGSGSGLICYMASKPQKDEGKYTKRGEIYTMVTHRPSAESFNVVSVHTGYKYKKGSTAEVAIGAAKFALFTHEETAWATDSADDAALVRAMRGGAKLIVRGRSWRDTATKDTYSLIGFTAAQRAINQACNAP